MAGTTGKPVLSSLQGPLRAIGSVVLPSAEALDERGWPQAEAIIEKALASKPSGMKRQIRLFLRLVNILPVLSKGRTLTMLPMDRREAFLQSLHRSRLMPLRRGLWGIRTLLFMGYYNQDPVRQGIGYGADRRGWAARAGGGRSYDGAMDDAKDPDGPNRANGADGADDGLAPQGGEVSP